MIRSIISSDVGEKAAGTARSCYISDLLEETKGQDEAGVRDTGANIYSGKRGKKILAFTTLKFARSGFRYG